jgi:hypothetical protein
MTRVLPVEGSCRCGAVRVRVSAPPMLTMACHCTGCQKMTASAFSLSAAFATEAFEVIQGEPVMGGLKGPDVHHYFCPECLTWMFSRPQRLGLFVNVRSTMLDEPAWSSPFIESYASEKLDWATTSAVHSYPKFPAFEDYQSLIAEYARIHASA